MATRNELESRRDALAAELARREAALSTSERQARHVLGSDRGTSDEEDADERYLPGERLPVERERRVVVTSGDHSSRRQAAQMLRGPRRLPTRNWRAEE